MTISEWLKQYPNARCRTSIEGAKLGDLVIPPVDAKKHVGGSWLLVHGVIDADGDPVRTDLLMPDVGG